MKRYHFSCLLKKKQSGITLFGYFARFFANCFHKIAIGFYSLQICFTIALKVQGVFAVFSLIFAMRRLKDSEQ